MRGIFAVVPAAAVALAAGQATPPAGEFAELDTAAQAELTAINYTNPPARIDLNVREGELYFRRGAQGPRRRRSATGGSR